MKLVLKPIIYFSGREGKINGRQLVWYESSRGDPGVERGPSGPEDERLPGSQEVLQEERQRWLPQIFPGHCLLPSQIPYKNAQIFINLSSSCFTMSQSLVIRVF